MADVGSQLRAAREAHSLSLEQAYKLTRIKAIYLEALEANRINVLPGLVQVRGFVRTYANFLGLDGEALAAALDADRVSVPEVIHAPVVKPVTTAVPQPIAPPPDRAMPPQPIAPLRLPKIVLSASRDTSSASPGGVPTTWLIVGAVALFLLGVLLVISALSGSGAHPAPTPSEANVPMSISASLAAPATDHPAVNDAVSITITTDEHVWVRVTVDGQMVFEGLMQPGASQTWDAQDQIIVETGNAAAVTVMHNGRSSALGQRGQIVARAWGHGGSEDVPLAASTTSKSRP